jgi:L-rhamnose mutarotase
MKKFSLLLPFILVFAVSRTSAQVAPVYGPTNPTPDQAAQASVQYYGSVIELKPGMEGKYRKLHSDVWPEVKAAIAKAHIRNYSIFVADLDGKRYLFSYFEYTGSDAKADFAGMANDPTTRDKWWPLTNACQIRLPGTPKGQQWMAIEQVMHID